MMKSSWKGYLKLSLVSCPVALYPATSKAERVSFRQINRKTGNRLKQQMIDSVTGEVVEGEDKGKGYEIGKETYVQVDTAELDDLKVESTRTIEIDSFVPRDQIDPRYLDSPYYIVPDGKVGEDAFAVIRDAITAKAVVGIGSLVLSSREHPVMIESFGKGLRATTLRYPSEVRAEDAYFEDIPDVKVPKETVALAKTIIEGKLDDFKPEGFVDHYEEALVELLKAKKAGVKAPKREGKSKANVVNLMDALKRSVAAEKPKKKAA